MHIVQEYAAPEEFGSPTVVPAAGPGPYLAGSNGAQDAADTLDEAWAVLSDLAIARWLRASAKLSRAHGVATMVVVHRLSDLTSAGDQGSEQPRHRGRLPADDDPAFRLRSLP